MSTPAAVRSRPRLRVERLLSERGDARVYLATTPDGEQVVVKECASTRSPSALSEAVREAGRVEHVMTQVRAGHTVEWRRYFEDEGRARIVRVFQDGVTLQEFVEAPQASVAVSETLGWMNQVVEIVSAFHEKGLVMPLGDVKPSHFILDEWEKVRLLDVDLLALARGVPTSSPQPMAWHQPWVAPEVSSGGGARDVRSDVYCVGAVFYALLTHAAPPDSLRLARGEDALAPVHGANPHVPLFVSELVHGMMAVRPEDRPSDLREVAMSLRKAGRAVRRDGSSQQSRLRRCPQCQLRVVRAAMGCRYCGLPVPAAKLIPMGFPAFPSGAAPAPRRSRVGLVAGLVVALLLLGGAAWWWSAHSTPTPAPSPSPTRGATRRPASPSKAPAGHVKGAAPGDSRH